MYLFYPSIFEAQINDLNLSSKQTNPIHVVKTGSYIGIQKGSYNILNKMQMIAPYRRMRAIAI